LKWFFCSDADFFAILFGRACACPSAAARGTSRDISAESSVEFRKIPEHEALNPYDVGRCLAWYVRYLHAQMSRRASPRKNETAASIFAWSGTGF
jgi:hypothetical protein